MQNLINRRRCMLAAVALTGLVLTGCKHLGTPQPSETEREGGGGGGAGGGGTGGGTM